MSKKLRIAQLTWLLAPIQKSVDTTKLQLDVFNKKSKALASPPADAEEIWYENQRKHRDEAFAKVEIEVKHIHAALAVAECVGGSALALEVKIIINNLADQRIESEKVESALISVLGSLLTIPKYIGMVVDGAPDSAGILAKQINELREIRGVPLLEEDNLLPPDIEFVYVEPPLRNRDVSEDRRQEVFGRSPKRFQTAFSSYLSNQNKAALTELRDILRDLQVVTQDLEVGCFWWVGECLTEALECGAIRSAGDTFTKIRMLSVAIQKAETDGEEGAKATLGIARFKSLLSVLSMSTKLPTNIEDVLAVFNVRKSVDATSIADLQARIEKASADSIKDVVVELGPLLETSMVSLGRAITSKSPHTFDAQISSFRTSIRQVASVFYMVNESEMAAVAAKSLTRVDKVQDVTGFTDEIIESLKGDFMFLDEHIRRLDSNESIKSLRIQGVKPDVIANVVEQAIQELALTRRSITDHLDSGTGIEDLKSGLKRLVGAGAALSFTGLTRSGLILNGSCQGFLSEMSEQGIKQSRGIEMAARALVAVEGYLEAILAGVEPSPTLLSKAEEALAELGIQVNHVDVVTPTELMAKFEAALTSVEEQETDENHFLSEISELRKVFEQVLQKPDVRDRKTMENLYKASDRLAMGAKLYGYDSFHRLARALGTYSQSVHSQSRDEGFDRQAADSLVSSALQMTFRCMDEYSARGKVSIFTKDMENALLAKSDPSIVQAIEEDEQVHHQKDIETKVETLPQPVLEGELVDDLTPIEHREYPDNVDGGHIDMYREEFATYHAILINFIESASHTLNRDICRAAHSLHGISGSVGCDVLHEVFGVLESRLEVMLTAGQEVTGDDKSQLRHLLDETRKFMLEFPWSTETSRLDMWVSIAADIGCEIEEAQFTEVPVTQAGFTVVPQVEFINEHVDVEAVLTEDTQIEVPEKISHAESFAVSDDEQPSPSTHVQPIEALISQANQTPEYNADFQFYLDEAEDVFPELEVNVAAWLSDMTDKNMVVTIKRNMHTLKGAALMAEASSIAAITHSMESLFESLQIKLISPGDECGMLVRHVMDAITTMTEQMKLGRAYQIPTALIECLEHCVNINKIDLSRLYADPAAGPEAETAEDAQENFRHSETLTTSDNLNSEVLTVDSNPPELGVQIQNDGAEENGFKSVRRKRGGRGKGGKRQASSIKNGDEGAIDLVGEQPDTLIGTKATELIASEVVEAIQVEPQIEFVDASPQVPTFAPETIQGPSSVSEYSEDQSLRVAPNTDDKDTVSYEEPIAVGPLVSELIKEENIPHAKTFYADPVRENYAREAAEAFNKLHTIEMVEDHGVEEPIISNAVMEMLARGQIALGEEGKKTNGGPTEKIRVDLRHLEAAAEKASELIAVRYRLNSLNEEAHLRLTGARELLDANSLQHGQLTTALRSFFNNQPQARKNSDADEADLERFNDLSAMHVAMGAQIDEVREQVHEIFAFIRQMRTALYEIDPALTGLQKDLLHSRLVPFINTRQKLFGAVTTAAKSTLKEVEASMEGEQVIMDKMMLDSIADPLTHILRNAIDHGIESPAERLQLGKTAAGVVKIKAYRRAKHIVIEISDDGRGINIDAVKRKAIEMKIIKESEQLSAQETMRLITHSGFSTAAKVTHVSGRGVGMDIVATTVEGLGGRLYIDSYKGKGTKFTIELPFTIGSNKAILAHSGSQWFAIQSYSMSQVLLVSRDELAAQRKIKGSASVIYDDRAFEVVHLADLVAMPDSRDPAENGGEVTLILCEQGDERIAIEVAKVDSMPEIHIRKLEGILSNVRGIVGETERQDGSPVFVLDVMELARLNLKLGKNGYQVRQNRVRTMKRETKPTVLIVDDSRSYRTQLERIFTGFGYAVVTAVDGQNALHKLSTGPKPDLMMVDVEMPNMNGFEFTEAIRQKPEYDNTPIIMITTRTGLEEKALRAGVTKYLLKPCDAPTLQQAVNQIKAEKQEHGVSV